MPIDIPNLNEFATQIAELAPLADVCRVAQSSCLLSFCLLSLTLSLSVFLSMHCTFLTRAELSLVKLSASVKLQRNLSVPPLPLLLSH